MDSYTVSLLSKAYRDLDEIYAYIAKTLLEPGTAEKLLDEIEEAIFSLEHLPNRGAPRRTGIHANKGYRQLFVKNYTIIYRVDETAKRVIIATVRYSRSEF